jgi:heme/copper-type cytochrome/quinol oxidase subunit 3
VSASHDDHHDDGHGHGHSPWIQHHYDDAQHQFDSGKLGIWLFLAQEVLFFSALFVAYILYRSHHPEIYAYAHKYLDVKYGAINTAVLIFSSLTAAWAVRAAQLRQRKLLIGCLSVTIICAMAFLGIKYVEYTHKIHEHLLPGQYFDPCISADNRPLLSKNNECPGSKGSVVWNHDKAAPETGCFPTFAIDQQPLRDGVQAECVVSENEFVKVVDNKGEGVVNPETKNALFKRPTAGKPIAKECESHGGEAHGGEACWKISHQPAVCRPGWFYSMRCTSGPGMEKLDAELAVLQTKFEAGHIGDEEAAAAAAAATAAKKDAVAAADAARKAAMVAAKKRLGEIFVASRCDKVEQYSVSDRFNDKGDCSAGRGKREKELKAIRDEEIKAACPDKKGKELDDCVKPIESTLTVATIGECVRSEQVGVVVEHHDHTVVPASIAVTASCKGPAKPAAEGDVFADKERSLQVGAKSAGTSEPAHDDHGARYAGPPPEHTQMFFTIYFAMTGLHGVHVLVGVFIFIWLLIRAVKGHFTPEYFGPVDWAALYWHIVDLIWIFLFPLMYLIH